MHRAWNERPSIGHTHTHTTHATEWVARTCIEKHAKARRPGADDGQIAPTPFLTRVQASLSNRPRPHQQAPGCSNIRLVTVDPAPPALFFPVWPAAGSWQQSPGERDDLLDKILMDAASTLYRLCTAASHHQSLYIHTAPQSRPVETLSEFEARARDNGALSPNMHSPDAVPLCTPGVAQRGRSVV